MDRDELALAIPMLLGLLPHSVDHDSGETKVGIDGRADLIDLIDRTLRTLPPEVGGSGHHDSETRGCQSLSGECAERRGTVDDDDVVALQSPQGSGELGGEIALARPGIEVDQVGVASDDVDSTLLEGPRGLGHRCLKGLRGGVGEHGRGMGRPRPGLEDRGGVALRIEIDDEDLEPALGRGSR